MTPTSTLPDHVHQLLHERFGYQDFRPGQEAIIGALLQGQHVLTVMPTGSGKSLCYQLPALLNEGCTLVISPLIALMKDQVDSLQAHGIAATFVNSSLSPQEQQERLYACRAGHYKLLYIAPERFRSQRFLDTIAQTRVSLFAVDEAHCISQWGHDFRPDYLRLRQAIEYLQQPQVLALTATATVEVQDDIVQQLGCAAMQRFVSGFDRPNLTYRVLGVKGQATKFKVLGEILDAQEEGSSIIYAATRRAVEEIASFLHERGTEALIYHAGLRDAERQRAQDAFMEGQCRLIVATNAFGMGVDKSDVRCVMHFNLPRSMEAYYQEAGRAGRDGLPAECVLLFSYGDVKIQEFLLEQSYPARGLLQEVYGLIAALSRERAEVPLRALLPLCRRSVSEMHLAACAKLLERAGYIERVSVYDNADDLSSGTPNTLVRLTGDSVAPHQLVIDDNALQQRKQLELQKMRRMVGYANARQCRRQKMLAYFGEQWDKPNCASCDNCLDDGAFGQSVQLSCVARMQGRFGRAKVVQVLLGSQANDIVNSYLPRLSTYGILKGASRSMIDVYLDALIEAECIQIVGDEFPKLDLTPLGQAVMRRQQRVLLALPSLTASAASQSSTATTLRNQPSPTASALTMAVPSLTPEVVHPPAAAAHASAAVAPRFTESAAPPTISQTPEPTCADALLEHLRAQRTALARAESLPPYCVFNDRTLREMATYRPTTPAGLLRIYGVGAAKASKYGETFLSLIRDHLAGKSCEG